MIAVVEVYIEQRAVALQIAGPSGAVAVALGSAETVALGSAEVVALEPVAPSEIAAVLEFAVEPLELALVVECASELVVRRRGAQNPYIQADQA